MRVVKFIKYIIFAIGVFVLLDLMLVFGFSYIQPTPKQADAIVILGAAINSPALYNRTTTALELYEQGKAPVIVLSGGKIADPDISEAQYMEKVIDKNAQGEPQIILEDQSHNTYENIKNTKAKLPEAKSLIIVSDRFHLARGVLVALRQGFYPVYWKAPDPSYYPKKELQYYYIRELIAMVNYIPKFIFNT
jgi:uncharacterized SAM-binding protein YcdF (DUF218 family)